MIDSEQIKIAHIQRRETEQWSGSDCRGREEKRRERGMKCGVGVCFQRLFIVSFMSPGVQVDDRIQEIGSSATQGANRKKKKKERKTGIVLGC